MFIYFFLERRAWRGSSRGRFQTAQDREQTIHGENRREKQRDD